MNFEKHTRSGGVHGGIGNPAARKSSDSLYAPGARRIRETPPANRGSRAAGGSISGNGGVNKLQKPPPRFSQRERPLFT